MRVALVGGTGFIGQETVRQLKESGDVPIVLSRDPERARALDAEVAPWNAETGFALPPCEAVIHLAGESISGRWNADKKTLIRESRTLGTTEVVSAIARMSERPSVLISASGVGFYGDTGERTVTEESSAGSGFLAQVCIAWEGAANAATSLGLRVVRARVGVVLDANGGALPEMVRPVRWGVGGPFGSGRQWISWIHRVDMARMLVHAVKSPIHGPMNGTAPSPVRNAEFMRALGRAVGRPAILPVPGVALRLVLGEFANDLLGGQRALPTVALETGFRFRYPDLEAALSAVFGSRTGVGRQRTQST